MGKFKDEGNTLVLNQSKQVLVNYNFMLRVEGIYDLPCKAVHSFTKENEFEYVQEGGLNDYVHMLRKPISKPFSFTVERYVGMDIIPPLALGAELTLPVVLMVAPNANMFDNAKRTFVFTGCTIMSKTYGELNAEKSDLLTETIVIGYREMTEVTIPVHEGSAGKLWKFDGKNVNGNGQRSARTLPEAEKITDKKETLPRVKKGPDTGKVKVRKYLIKEGQSGTSVKSAQTYTDIYGKELEAANPDVLVARKWPEKSSAKTLPEPENTTDEEEKTLPRVKKGPDTGKVKIRKYLIKKGQSGTSVKSAQTYADIYGKELEAANPDILVARKWPEKSSAKDGGLKKTSPKIRKYLIKKGQSGTSVKSAQTYADIYGQELKAADPNTLVARKWPEAKSAKPGPDTGTVEKRRWEPDVSAKHIADTGQAKARKWPPVKSAKSKS